jgi:hypothetical protein
LRKQAIQDAQETTQYRAETKADNAVLRTEISMLRDLLMRQGSDMGKTDTRVDGIDKRVTKHDLEMVSMTASFTALHRRMDAFEKSAKND